MPHSNMQVPLGLYFEKNDPFYLGPLPTIRDGKTGTYHMDPMFF